MKENLTELVFILDRSGSMSGMEADTIGGFNAMIKKQRREEGEAYVTTVLFDSESTMLHDRLPLGEVPAMTEKDYSVGGCTALLDALGDTVKHIANIHKYAKKEDVPAHTLFVITTDGMENASRHYDSDEVKKLVKQHEEKDGWEFLFLGANIDAVETAKHFGIRADHAVDYVCDEAGTALNFEVLSEAIADVRSDRVLTGKWKSRIEADHRKRGR